MNNFVIIYLKICDEMEKLLEKFFIILTLIHKEMKNLNNEVTIKITEQITKIFPQRSECSRNIFNLI